MKALLAVVALFMASSANAQASRVFEPYEGRAAIQEGEGGTKVVKDGIEFWTTGTPPRRYQIIGILRDSRPRDFLNPDPVGSRGSAKKIREVGGDAAIVQSKQTRIAGSHFEATTTNNSATVREVEDKEQSTTFLVIRYVQQ